MRVPEHTLDVKVYPNRPPPPHGDRADREELRGAAARREMRELDRLELYRALSRLYRSRILQVNTRWKALSLAEIHTMHAFAPFSKLNVLFKND